MDNKTRIRCFKTAWFGKAAAKARINDAELASAVAQAIAGQAESLGGGVFKKRLGKNLYRSIIIANAGKFWVYVYLFAKQDRSDIDPDELDAFKKLAGDYSSKSLAHIEIALAQRELLEVHRDEQSQTKK